MGGARPVSVGLFLGLTVTSIGGPLALIALYIPQALDGAGSSAGLSTLMATLVFLFPLAVWYRYSESIASSGGLYAFVEAATGPALARVQAAFWVFSYFLYLVYTVPFIVYDLLPVAFPASSHYRPLLDVCLVLLICAVMLSPLVITLSLTALLAAFQAVVAVLLTVLTLAHLGAPATSFVGHGNLTPVLQGAGRISSLYICASLPLFLGGEVRGGGKAVRQGIAWGLLRHRRADRDRRLSARQRPRRHHQREHPGSRACAGLLRSGSRDPCRGGGRYGQPQLRQRWVPAVIRTELRAVYR